MSLKEPLARYENGGTQVTLFPDGTKVRDRIDEARPPPLPEQIDLKITDWCDAGCAWCHEGSTRRGRHADVDRVLGLLHGLPRGFEIAIGGGDPLSHPRFEELVAELTARGYVPSVTVNGRHFGRSRDRLEAVIARGHLYGVGVSFHEAMPEWDYPHHVVHMIAGIDPVAPLEDGRDRRVLVLGYKDWGRGAGFKRKRRAGVDENLGLWFRVLPWLAERHHLSFDTLAIEQLRPDRVFARRESFTGRFMGGEGEFSMYIDGVKEEYAVSSYAPERRPWGAVERMFGDVRRRSGFRSAA